MSASQTDAEQDGRCYGCFRPLAHCFCAAIPTIDNRTDVVIVQHRRERRHRFNTARIVERALRNARVIVDQPAQLAERLTFHPQAGLLYPGPDSTLLDDLPPPKRPRQLVVLDGTWHHTKTFLRDFPALAALPCYRLAPTEPSRYRIRREPVAAALSTVEAVVAALRLLEPDTQGFAQLLAAFAQMVERQLAHPRAQYRWRRNERHSRGVGNIPRAVLGDPNSIVVAYAEALPRGPGARHEPRTPAYWTAERLGTGETYATPIRFDAVLEPDLYAHWRLAEEQFAAAPSLDEVRSAWRRFLRPQDVVAVYAQSTVELLETLVTPTPHIVLRSINMPALGEFGTLDELIAAGRLQVEAKSHDSSRAAARLANSVALVRHLRTFAQQNNRTDLAIGPVGDDDR